MEVFGYVASIGIGVTLGLIGGGGSILAVPVLVYLFNIEPVLATAYSLFIVGTTSSVGSINYFRNDHVNLKTALFFGFPSIIAIYLTRKFLLPMLPDIIWANESFELTKNLLLMLLFAVLMIFAAYNMIKKPKSKTLEQGKSKKSSLQQFVLQGILVGFLSGMVGAGGGFLIIPALVLLSKLEMKEAIGTSLLIITVNSMIGFFSDQNLSLINWPVLLKISGFALLGIFLGMELSKKVNGMVLKPAFGWFVLLMGIFVILKETVLR